MIQKKKKKNKDEKLIEEFRAKIKSCEAELSKLEAYVQELERKLIKQLSQLQESKQLDKELRKKIEILVRKMQSRW